MMVGKWVPEVTDDQLELLKDRGWVKVIRCKECKHWLSQQKDKFSGTETGYCKRHKLFFTDSDYCSKGE